MRRDWRSGRSLDRFLLAFVTAVFKFTLCSEWLPLSPSRLLSTANC